MLLNCADWSHSRFSNSIRAARGSISIRIANEFIYFCHIADTTHFPQVNYSRSVRAAVAVGKMWINCGAQKRGKKTSWKKAVHVCVLHPCIRFSSVRQRFTSLAIIHIDRIHHTAFFPVQIWSAVPNGGKRKSIFPTQRAPNSCASHYCTCALIFVRAMTSKVHRKMSNKTITRP